MLHHPQGSISCGTCLWSACAKASYILSSALRRVLSPQLVNVQWRSCNGCAVESVCGLQVRPGKGFMETLWTLNRGSPGPQTPTSLPLPSHQTFGKVTHGPNSFLPWNPWLALPSVVAQELNKWHLSATPAPRTFPVTTLNIGLT